MPKLNKLQTLIQDIRNAKVKAEQTNELLQTISDKDLKEQVIQSCSNLKADLVSLDTAISNIELNPEILPGEPQKSHDHDNLPTADTSELAKTHIDNFCSQIHSLAMLIVVMQEIIVKMYTTIETLRMIISTREKKDDKLVRTWK